MFRFIILIVNMIYNLLPAQTVLQQLEENQRLRLQLFRSQTSNRDQINSFLSVLRNQSMHIQKITTQLAMFIKRSKQQQQQQQSEESAVNLIKNCLLDLQTLADSIVTFETECEQREEALQKVIEGEEQTVLLQLTKKIQEAQHSLEYLGGENQKLTQTLKNAEKTINTQTNTINSQSQELTDQHEELKTVKQQNRQFTAQLQALKQSYQKQSSQNQSLSAKLREVKEGADKHVEYIRKKTAEVELENEKLVMKQREAVCRQTELIRLIEEREEKIERLEEEVKRVKVEVMGYQQQFRAIIEQDQRIKTLQRERNRKQQEVQTRRSVREAMRDVTSQHNNEKSQNRVQSLRRDFTRKFNLLAFQQKLSQSQASQTH